MWIQGGQRGNGKELTKHLQKEENEAVEVREIDGFTFSDTTKANLERAIRQMQSVGLAKGQRRNLYHAILAPAYGETLSKEQRDFLVAYYLEHMKLTGHQYVLVEHWKNGKQHFHLVINIIDPVTGRTHPLKWTRNTEWRISRGVEQILGLSTAIPKGRSVKTWEMQRSKRTGVDARQVRKVVTKAFRNAKSAPEFIALLEKADLTLCRDQDKLILCDKVGDPHGLVRRIEGATLADVKKKFPGLAKAELPHFGTVSAERKPFKTIAAPDIPAFIDPEQVRRDVQSAYDKSRSGVEFFVLINRSGYSIGRGLNGFAAIDANGGRYDFKDLLGKETVKGLPSKFPDLAAIRPRPVSEILRRLRSHKSGHQQSSSTWSSGRTFTTPKTTPLPVLFSHAARASAYRQPQNEQKPAPFKPQKSSSGWPEAAVQDWEAWGHKDPVRFFTKWPELKPDGFIIMDHKPS